MSLAQAPLSGCTGKVRFESFVLARKVQDRRARNNKGGEPYRCKHCTGWHLGQRSLRKK